MLGGLSWRVTRHNATRRFEEIIVVEAIDEVPLDRGIEVHVQVEMKVVVVEDFQVVGQGDKIIIQGQVSVPPADTPAPNAPEAGRPTTIGLDPLPPVPSSQRPPPPPLPPKFFL